MALSSCLRYGERKGILDRSPLSGVPAPRKQRPKDDIEFASAQAAKLLANLAADQDPDFCRWLMQFVGLRRAERLGLQWSCVKGLDTDEPVIEIKYQLARRADGSGWYLDDRTKTYKERFIVLNEPFVSALRDHKAAQDDFKKSEAWQPDPKFADLVFLQPDGSLITLNRDNNDWHKTLDHYDLPQWRAHLNRHITATWLAEQETPVSAGTLQSILGHDTEAMAYYYSKTTKKQQSGPMLRYGEAISRARTLPWRGPNQQPIASLIAR